MPVLSIVIIAYSLFSLCDTAVVDTLKKCSIKDDECLRLLYQNTLQKYAKPGIPELNISSLEPFEMRDLSVKMLDTITVTMHDGVVAGVGDCILNSFHMNLEERVGTNEVTCTVTAIGKVRITGASPALESVLGTTVVDIRGKGKLTFDEFHFEYDAPFNLFKKADGEIYLILNTNQVKVKYFEIKNASLTTEDIFIGNKDINQLVSSYFNDNWRTVEKTLGEIFLGHSVGMYYDLVNKFFTGVPTTYYIIEDLSSYVKH